MQFQNRRAGAVAKPPVPAAAEAVLRQRLAEDPSRMADWQQLAGLCAQSGRHAEAVEAFAQAVAAGASATALAMPYALSLSALGRHAEAVSMVQAAQAKKPKEFAFANLLGVLLKRAGRLREAIPPLELAKRLDPRSASPWNNLGNIHELLGDYAAAAAAFEGGLKRDPRNADLWRMYGRSLRRMGEQAKALTALERGFMFAPGSRDALADLLSIRLDHQQYDLALAHVEKARQANPANPALDPLAAHIHLRAGRRDQAMAMLQQVMAKDPANQDACLMLARLHGDGDRKAANEVLQSGLKARPESIEILATLIDSLARSRYGSETEHIEAAYKASCHLFTTAPDKVRHHARALRTVMQRCLDLDRLDAMGPLAEMAKRWVAEGSVSGLHYELGCVSSLEDRIQIVEWHREWGQRVARRIAPIANRPAMPALSTGRRIRIGFMSSDLRDHPVSYFAQPLLELYDRDRFEVFCYSFYEGAEDRIQAHFTSKVDAFRWWPRQSDAQVAEGIAADGLDILFELGGSTAMNKLEVMAYKPARIGASWLGYPHSAGLETIDYILTDPYIRPDDPRLLIEKPFELADTWVTLGRLGFPPVPIEEELPEDRRGYLTFGTMNNPYKFNRSCVETWAAVLRAVPGSHFLFVRPEASSEPFITNARAAFAAQGIDPNRIEFFGVRGKHLPHYNKIDIALDSFPHVGGTTTCETLWMGVPVVSLVGPGFPERLSYSNLSNAGVGDLAVFSVQDYIAKACELVADKPRRKLLRHGLRRMISENPLGQAPRFAQSFYAKVEEVVRQ